MKRCKKQIALSFIFLVIISLCSYIIVLGSNTNNVNEVLAGLLDIKNNLIKNGKDVPANIDKKIALETSYTEELKKNLEKCKKEVEEMEAKRKIDPHYGELNIKPGNDPRPADSISIIDNPDFSKVMTTFGTRFGEDAISNMIITNMVGTEYNIILAGCDKDNTTGILLNIVYKQDSFDIVSDKLVFPQKGKIVFTNIDEKKNIVEFSYGENRNGYFDLVKNEAIFK